MIGGISLWVLALGCQAPTTVPARPRTVVKLGSLGVDAGSDLALVFRRDENCGGYTVQQATSGKLDQRIVRFELRITGKDLINEIVQPITRDEFAGECERVFELFDLPVGTYDLLLIGYDASDKPISTGRSSVTIAAGKSNPVTIECDFDTGDLEVIVKCCSPAPLPSVAPSATSTPVPSPLPSSASPLPSPPTAFAVYDRFHGIHADVNGNVFLSGLPAKPWPGATPRYGRTLGVHWIGHQDRYLASGSLNGGWNTVYYESEMDPLLSSFFGADMWHFSDALTVNPQDDNVNATNLKSYGNTVLPAPGVRGGFLRPWGASARQAQVDPARLIIGIGSRDPARAASYSIVRLGRKWPNLVVDKTYVDRSSLVGARKDAIERPLSMIWDSVHDRPVWACKRGILTAGSSPTAEPIVLLARPAYALTKVSDSSDEVLFTTYEDGDKTVYYMDLDSGQPPVPAFTFRYGAPHRVEKGADGKYYVLLAEPPLPFDAASGNDPYMYENPGKKQIRAVRFNFDSTSKKLVAPKLVANSFQSGAASW